MASQKKVKQESGKGAGNALEKLAALHNDVEELSNELSKEAEKLELLFDKKREAIFERRLALLKEVPEFWITAVRPRGPHVRRALTTRCDPCRSRTTAC